MHIHSALRNQWHKAATAVVAVKALVTNALPATTTTTVSTGAKVAAFLGFEGWSTATHRSPSHRVTARGHRHCLTLPNTANLEVGEVSPLANLVSLAANLASLPASLANPAVASLARLVN